MSYDTIIYEICEKLLSTTQFYSGEFFKDEFGDLMHVRIYSKTDIFSGYFIKHLIELKGSLLVSFRSDDSGRPVITIYNDIEP